MDNLTALSKQTPRQTRGNKCDVELLKVLDAFEDTTRTLLTGGAAATIRLEVSINCGGITRSKIGYERAL